MLYHRLGFIGQKAYDDIKRRVRQLLCQELSRRKDLPAGGVEYEHIRPERIGQIWAEDFTEIVLDGIALKLALLIDVFSQYILGWALAFRASEDLVSKPVHQALGANGNHGPENFLLRDNGRQYASESHGELLAAHEIIGRNIPAFTPQYNGAVECGGKEFKNVFYNVWERREREGTDKEKTLLERAEAAAAETVCLLNEKIPRPALGGVSPADVHQDRKQTMQEEIKNYRQEQEVKGKPPPLSRPFWDVLKSGVKAEEMSTKELLIKLAFFGMRPLRRVAQINRMVWGN
jgi:transposase InsO family protein